MDDEDYKITGNANHVIRFGRGNYPASEITEAIRIEALVTEYGRIQRELALAGVTVKEVDGGFVWTKRYEP